MNIWLTLLVYTHWISIFFIFKIVSHCWKQIAHHICGFCKCCLSKSGLIWNQKESRSWAAAWNTSASWGGILPLPASHQCIWEAANDDGSSRWVPVTLVGEQDGIHPPGFILALPYHCRHLENELLDGKFVCVCVILPFK